MAEVPLFADAADVAKQVLLNDPAFTAPAHTKIPNPRPTMFCFLRRVGGPRLNLVTDGAEIVVESFAANGADAADLAQLARRSLLAARGTIIGGVPIGKVQELSGPGDLPDPISEQPRVTQRFLFATRGLA